MRQAMTTMILAISFSLCTSPGSFGNTADVAGAIVQAQRLIQANDHASAAALLEDALLEAQDKEKPAVIELLRKSYEVMAKKAEAAGHSREAAHYRDNLDILNPNRETKAPSRPPVEKARTPLDRKRAATENKPFNAPETPRPRSEPSASSLPGPARSLAQVQPPEPAAAPGPSQMPLAEFLTKLLSQTAPAGPQASTSPAAPSLPQNEQNQSGPGAEASRSNLSPSPQTGAQLAVKAATPSQTAPRPLENPSPATPTSDLQRADRLFTEKRYDEAGRGYAALARANRLPVDRKEHWAYCRWFDVVRRINGGPRSAREWDEIEVEVQSIQRLTPNSWYGEYLRTKVADLRRNGSRSLARSNNVVIRGSTPDEPDAPRFPRLFGMPRSGPASQPKVAASPAAAAPAAELPLDLPSAAAQPEFEAAPNGSDAPSTDPDKARSSTQSPRPADGGLGSAGDESKQAPGSSWQISESTNFRIFHQDARLAQAAAEIAEAVRAAQTKKWSGLLTQRPWTPRCDLYLYPNGKTFAQATKQPETSPGFSTLISDGSRITTRRISLRADHPQLLPAILPHEATHVVLADLFIAQQIPRWADEGIAVLAEPRAEQHLRWAELEEPLASGRVFELSRLMAMDYPTARDWSLYYAQSVSLTHFLVEQGTPQKFIEFVRDSQRNGIEAALRDHYQISGFARLQDRWLAHARRQVATVTASSRDSDGRNGSAEFR